MIATTTAPATRTEQIHEIRILPGNFPRSLVDQYRRKGDLSDCQWVYVAKLFTEMKRPKISLDFPAIVALLAAALTHLKFPKIRLALADGRPIVLGLAGRRSRHCGAINITDGGRYGENIWYGRIETDGKLVRSRDCNNEVVGLLKSFSDNPAAVAATYGRLTGSCCFCGKGLTDDRSTTVGYGPVCAQNYGLNWG